MGGAKTFLAIDDADNKTVLGFYSLSPASVQYARTPEILRRGLARHDVPGFRLARLAVDRKLQGRGLGGGQKVDGAFFVTRRCSWRWIATEGAM